MDPEADPVLPPPSQGGGMGGGAPLPRSSHSSSRRSQRSGPIQPSPSNDNIILRISPAAGSATFGYIYIADTELRHQDAITAYFDSAGREISVIPCPDFESFIVNNNLMYRDVLFITDLPRYIIPAGIPPSRLVVILCGAICHI